MSTTEIYCFWNNLHESQPTCWNKERILAEYWEYWSSAMKDKFGEDVELDPDKCVEDWATVNWAWRKDD
jgi:hypothetical protein